MKKRTTTKKKKAPKKAATAIPIPRSDSLSFPRDKGKGLIPLDQRIVRNFDAKKKTISKTLIIDSTECTATSTVPITTTTDSVVPKNLSEILEKNVSTFPTGFSATISSEIYDAMFREILVEYKLCDQASKERPIGGN